MTKTYKQQLADFRDTNFKELKVNLKVAVAIRDSEDASPKDRMEAIKYIGRSLGILTPDRAANTKGPTKSAVDMDTPLTPKQEAELEEYLNRG